MGQVVTTVSKELSFYAAEYLITVQTSYDNLVMQAMVWRFIVQFRVTWFGVFQFGASHVNLS
jgi:hypothetical protein